MDCLTIFFVTFLSVAVFFFFFRAKDGLPTEWPFVGGLPALIKNKYRIHQFVIESMEKSQNTTLCLMGPWFSNMNMLCTVDPANIDHVFSRNVSNYSKGKNFHEIFEAAGDGIFNAEGTLWQYHRKLNHSFFSHPKLRSNMINTVCFEIKKSLIPLFEHASKNNIEIDLQDVFLRFSFDNICSILMHDNPNFLSLAMPPIPFIKALAGIEEVIFKRHLEPTWVWKSLRWLGVGEAKYKKDCETIDDFIYSLIRRSRSSKGHNNEVSFNLLNYIEDEEDNAKASSTEKGKNDQFLRDTIFSLIAAGGNTTSVALSWFFYLISNNPRVTTKIRDELHSIISNSKETSIDGVLRNFDEYNNKFLYLHAAIYETLRLYPPVAYNHKASIKSDILPSGHHISPNTLMLFDMYAIGRMKSTWGEDCNEFKPERWMTQQGNIKVTPSNKFLSFGAGPRICQGKDASFLQMKIVIVAIIFKYDVDTKEGHQVVPDELSFVLYLKHGLKVKIKPHLY